MVQLLELAVIEAEPFDEVGGNLFLHRAAVRERADRNLLDPWVAFADLAVTLDAEVVRDHATRDDRFTEPPARLDHELVRPVRRGCG